MKTQDLIGILANDVWQTQATPKRQLQMPLIFGGAVCSVFMLIFWGLNPTIDQLATHPAFIIKMLWLTSFMGFGLYGLLRLSRPGVNAGHTWIGIGMSLLVMVTLGLVQTLQSLADERVALWMGYTWQVCSASIFILALPVLGALLWALRQLAPTRPLRTGALAGFMAGSVAASIYSLHCIETSFVFFSIWYVAGIALASILGALLGPRCLRW